MGRRFVYGGVRDTMTGHARRLGIPISTLWSRASMFGNRPENYDILFCRHSLGKKQSAIGGKSVNISHLARQAGMSPTTVYSRLARGATLSQALARGSWRERVKAKRQTAHGNHTRRKLAALGIFA